ncbi:MAG TPA: glycoside hydrolase family 2 TIM barrel-domain containing protein [Pirellulales bacterium]|nr:glycoside hydrolase family 2 TIM barrel-domain containing protein [Pirellulales bacterium]
MQVHLAGIFSAIVLAASTAMAEAQRQTLPFNQQWKFQLGDPADASQPGFDDSTWRTLNVPHDYSIEGPPGKDPSKMEGPFDPDSPGSSHYDNRQQKAVQDGGGGYLDAGVAWYRKTFTPPASAKGKRVAMVFDGVYMNSDVYLNGKLLGNHPYGYTPFQYDITDDLKFDAPNTLAVRCNVEQPCSRWYSGAGIFRPVHLVITDPVHIAPWGTYVVSEKAGADSNDFTVTVKTTVRNDSDAEQKCKFSTKIFDLGVRGADQESRDFNNAPLGTAVAEATSDEQAIPAHSEATLSAKCTVSSPHLWSVDSPHLYRALTTVSEGGQPTDAVTDRIGFRTIEFTADNGFLLNGKRLQIQGTCNHHDLGALGSAFNTRAMERQLQILKDMGDNALRTSHNPPAKECLDLADELGFVVMDEAFDEWKRSKTKMGYGRFFDDWSEPDITAMIHRDRNHPSVVLWSIGNEIPEQGAKNGGEMAKRLSDIAHREDPTRPTVSACNNPNSAVRTGFADALDVMGINYNINNYDVDHKDDRKLIASETASALSTRGEYGLYLNDDGQVKIKIRPDTQCTSYDLDRPPWGHTAETSLLALKKHPWVAGEFVWTGFDYIGEPTPFPWPARSSYFGIVDLAGFPKDRFYIYQASWSDKPMVHLLPHWNWEQFAGKEIPVWAFTNGDSVELFLNGKSLGTKEAKDLVQTHYEWKVPFEPGTLKAVAKKDGKEWATDEVTTAGKPAKLELKADRSKIYADGDDLSFVTARVIDKDGHVCPDADNEIKFKLDGPAAIAGLENGDPTNHEQFQGVDSRKAFHGLALAIVRAQETGGTAKLTATAEGLEPATVNITLKPEAGK